MLATLKLSARNLLRYRRRTVLTAALITIGVVAMLLFVAAAGSFKQAMVAQITDGMLGHLQLHARGYTASIDNLPLNLNLAPEAIADAEQALKAQPAVQSWSVRVKLGAMFSNFTETTTIRLNGVDPKAEESTAPALRGRIVAGQPDGELLAPGQVLIPDLLANGMNVKPGDTVVLVATNKQGSVNGKTFTVRAVLEPVTGPGGRDGYVHIADARELLRMEKAEAMEIAVRLRSPERLGAVQSALQAQLAAATDSARQPVFELHGWTALTPFASIAAMIDLMTLFIRVMLIAIVLVSVTNVMLMAVYERIREIGTLAAIGTPPGRILGLYVGEGFFLGVLGAAAGVAISIGVVALLNANPLTFPFARQSVTLRPVLSVFDVGAVSAIVVAVAILASLQPAWRASRMDPILALRHV